MGNYTDELKAVQERLNEVLRPFGHRVDINHQSGWTVMYIVKLDTNTANLLQGGLTDKTAIQYIRAMLDGHKYTQN